MQHHSHFSEGETTISRKMFHQQALQKLYLSQSVLYHWGKFTNIHEKYVFKIEVKSEESNQHAHMQVHTHTKFKNEKANWKRSLVTQKAHMVELGVPQQPLTVRYD